MFVFSFIVNPIFRLVMRIVSIVVFLLTILSAYGGKFNPEYITLPSVMCLAMPYFAIVTILFTLFWLFSKKIIFTALGVFTIIACMDPLSQAMPLSFPKKAAEGDNTVKIMSWNVLHTEDLREPQSPTNRAVEYMVKSGADVICLTELNNFGPEELRNAGPELIDSLNKAYPYRAGLSSTDIKVLSKYPVSRGDVPLVRENGHSHFDFFKVDFPGGKVLNVAMVHLYSYDLSEEERDVVKEMKTVDGAKESVKELRGSILGKMRNAFRRRAENARALREAIDKVSPSSPLIVCGDFNDVPASWAYNIIRGDDLRDAYAETNIGPTFTYNLHAFYFHIDQMLYRGPLEALRLKVGKIKTSDHYPLIGEFSFKNE